MSRFVTSPAASPPTPSRRPAARRPSPWALLGVGLPLALPVALLVALLVAASGCSHLRDPALAQVRIKAEKDLKCEPDFIEIDSLWGGRYRAEGCGRVAEYDSVCEGLQCDVSRSGEEAPAWRGRHDPNTPGDFR